MGGYSSEYLISLKSGAVVMQHLSKELYTPYEIHIFKDKWVLIFDKTEFPINKHDFSAAINGKKITFDCVFNAIHGTPGEDGQILSYFELLKIFHSLFFYSGVILLLVRFHLHSFNFSFL